MTDDDRKLIERARSIADSYLPWPLRNQVIDRDDLDRLIALAERGLELEGATEAWAIITRDNTPGWVFPSSELADKAFIRQPGDEVRRILILPAQTGGTP